MFRDHPRMRFRLARVFEMIAPNRASRAYNFGKFVEFNLGFSVLKSGVDSAYFPYESVLRDAEIVDLLDMVTLAIMQPNNLSDSGRQRYVKIIQGIFDDTQVGYQLDEMGGVHPKFDEEFERVRVSAISNLGGQGFEAERVFVELAEKALLENPIDGRQAIRSTFDAVENLFKKIFQVNQLNKAVIQTKLKPALERLYEGEENKHIRMSSLKQAEALIDWTDGAHLYRHAPGESVPKQPSDELTLLSVSNGLAYLRWLVDLKQRLWINDI